MATDKVKLIDFGLSTFIAPGEKLNARIGSLEFMVDYINMITEYLSI